jgi:Tol biopolymer transport system component
MPKILAVPVAGGSARVLVQHGGYPYSWARDGRMSFVRANRDPGQSDIWIADVRGGGAKDGGAKDGGAAQATTPGVDDAAVLSPDGRYVASMSGAGEAWEIVVQPALASGERWSISGPGGSFPRWSADGHTVFFFRDSSLFAVDVSGGPAHASSPRRLFSGGYAPTFGHAFSVSPDAERFLMLRPTDPRTTVTRVSVVQGWLGDVSRRLRSARASR